MKFIKNSIYIFSFLLFVVNSNLCFGQAQYQYSLQTEIEITHTSKKRSADGIITIEMKNGNGPYKIYLSKKPALTKQEDIIETKNINFVNGKVSFENLIKGSYFIISVDADEKFSIDEVTIVQLKQ